VLSQVNPIGQSRWTICHQADTELGRDPAAAPTRCGRADRRGRVGARKPPARSLPARVCRTAPSATTSAANRSCSPRPRCTRSSRRFRSSSCRRWRHCPTCWRRSSRGSARTAASIRWCPASGSRRCWSLSATPEVLDDALGVPLRPWHVRAHTRVLLVERDQEPHQLAAYRRRPQYLGQLGQLEQPLGVPRRPVRVVAVDDAIYDVMRLAGLVKESGSAGGVIVHGLSLANGSFGAQALGGTSGVSCNREPPRAQQFD
jgi:hypothetical protein